METFSKKHTGRANSSGRDASIQGRHVPELDGLRGIAVLGVLLTHAIFYLGVVPLHTPGQAWGDVLAMAFASGWGGVDLFFTLSGFLITGILLRSRQETTYFSSFYMRRILRIFPLYYGFLAITFMLPRIAPVIDAQIPHGLKTLLSYFFFVQNWPLFWRDWTGMATIWGAYWSLAVEEQFYLIWPALVRTIRPHKLLLICIVGLLTEVSERAYMLHRHGLALGVMQWPFSRLDGLFIGAAIATYSHLNGRPLPLLWAWSTGAIGIAILFWIAAFHTTELSNGGGFHIWVFGVLAFALISASVILAIQHRTMWTHRVFTFRPLVAAGKVSYGMYVYHLLIYANLTRLLDLFIRPRFGMGWSLPFAIFYIAIAITITMWVAMLSYRFIEKPFLDLKRFFPSRNPNAIQG
jgi:peptidoglycan/LPS O-acetylase OafA/YrhL